jgi:hypothetical protein
MSGLLGKTPSESYGDLLVVGDTYKGLSEKMEFITDGLGNNTPIACSKHSIDINCGGGVVTSYRFNSMCYKFDLIRSSWTDYHTVYVGQPPEVVLMTYYSDPYVSESYNVSVSLLAPMASEMVNSLPVYAETRILYTNGGVDASVVFSSPNGYPIYGLTSYSKPTGSSVDILKIQFYSNNFGSDGAFFISLESEDFFKSGGESPLTRPKELCINSVNLYEDYVRTGKVEKTAVPLAKSAPGGSYRDLLYLNNSGNGIPENTSPIRDGAGNISLISLSESVVEIDTSGGTIKDPIIGSSAISTFELNINDSISTYTVSENIKDHIVLKYDSSTSDIKDFYIHIDVSNVPYINPSNSSESNMFKCTLSAIYDTFTNFNIHVKFFNSNNESEYFTTIIPAGSSYFMTVKKYIVIFSSTIEEVISY